MMIGFDAGKRDILAVNRCAAKSWLRFFRVSRVIMVFLLYGYLFVDTGTFRVPVIASTTTVIAYCKSQHETGGGVQLSWWLLAFLVFCSSRLRGETSYLPASNSVSPLARIIILLLRVKFGIYTLCL